MSSTEISIEMENRGGRDVQGGCSRRGGGHREGPCSSSSSSRRHFSQGHRLKQHCIFIFSISFAVGISPWVGVSALQPTMHAWGGGLKSMGTPLCVSLGSYFRAQIPGVTGIYPRALCLGSDGKLEVLVVCFGVEIPAQRSPKGEEGPFRDLLAPCFWGTRCWSSREASLPCPSFKPTFFSASSLWHLACSSRLQRWDTKQSRGWCLLAGG